MTACRRGRSRVLPRVIAPVLLVVAMTTACESEQAGPQVPTAPSTADVRPALLDAAWTAPAPAGAQVAGRLRAWTTKDRVTVVGKQQIRSYDLASGKAAWTAALPRGTTGVCTISENAGDIGALLLRTKTGCTDVAALSLADGSWRWRHAIEPLAKGTPSVSLSRLAVAATGKCRQVIRFGVAEGRRLKPVAPADSVCANASALAGNTIAVKLDAGPDFGKVGDELIGTDAGKATFQVLNNDDLTSRWRISVDRVGANVAGVVAQRPLVLDTSLKGHRMLRVFDAKGTPVRSVGWSLPSQGFVRLGLANGVLLGGYGPADPGRYAYSLKTGNQLWTDLDDKTTRTLGLFRGRVLRERLVTGDDGEESWLALHELDRAGGSVTDPATNSRSVLIGRVPSQGLASWVWSGRRAIAFSGAKISAYDLPVKGKKVDALPVAEALPWADGDLQPSTAPGACRRVSAETLAALGLASAKLPAPADCRWRETLDPSYVERNLRTSVDIATPTDSTTAQAAAERRAEKLTDTLKADGLTPSALEGLGDQAWFATRPSTDGAQTETAIVARWRNAVVLVRASQAGLIEDRYAELVRPDAVESAVVGAAREILAALGAPAKAPTRGKDGPHTATSDLCKSVATAAKDLVEDAPSVATTPRQSQRRLSGCHWGTLSSVYPYLTVSAYAVPPSAATGQTAVRTAAAAFAADGRDDVIKGLGDEAEAWGFQAEGGGANNQVVTARQGNLLVTVQYGDDRPPAELRAAAVEIVREVLSRAS